MKKEGRKEKQEGHLGLFVILISAYDSTARKISTVYRGSKTGSEGSLLKYQLSPCLRYQWSVSPPLLISS